MSPNLYYGVKDPEYNFGFINTDWLTPYQILDKLNIDNFNSYQINPNHLIYPNELLISESTKSITDLILLAKYTDKYGNLKLKSIFLSSLISTISATAFPNKILILSIEKDAYYWSKVNNAHLIPKHAFRVGFDNAARQFSYIGRMKVSSLLTNQQQSTLLSLNNLRNVTNTITNLFGSLINIYEYIPAIVLQLHDLDNQFDSFWSRVRLSIKNSNSNTAHLDFNLVSSNYEVLCLKKQPAMLKQLCIIQLVRLEEETFKLVSVLEQSSEDKKSLEINRSLRSLPSSIRNLLWPSYLVPGQCVIKNGKMRSVNGIYELNINQLGSLRFLLVDLSSTQSTKVITFEKNVESLLVSKTGIYIVYDNNQATRRPSLLYKHQIKPVSSDTFMSEDQFESLFDNSLCTSFIMELSDNGFLRVIVQKSRPNVINLINLNDYFRPMNQLKDPMESKEKEEILVENSPLYINVRFIANLKDLRDFPMKIINLVVSFLRSIFQSMFYRVPAQLN